MYRHDRFEATGSAGDARSVDTSWIRAVEERKSRGLPWVMFLYRWVTVGASMKVDADDLQTNETDDRGRIYLGTEYANKRVTVALVEVESDGPDEDELAAAYREASESASDLADEWDGSSDEAWDDLDE